MLNETHLKVGYGPYSTREVQLLVSYLVTDAFVHKNVIGFSSCSPFLKACIEEFTATYDEKLLGWNGAGLLNRVATNTTHVGGKRWLDEPDLLSVQHPFAFFPISLHEVKR